MKRLHQIAIALALSLAAASFAQPAKPEAPGPSAKPASAAPGMATNTFVFPGGNLQDFIKAIQEGFGVNLVEEATVPGEYLYQIHVPKMKVIGPYVRVNGNPPYSFQAVLAVYNNLAENGVKGLGKWVLAPLLGGEYPSTIVFVPPPPEEADMLHKVRAFSIDAKSDSERASLKDSLVEALNFYAETRHIPPGGTFRYHPGSGLLIAIGDESYLNLISEVVKALKESKAAAPKKF